MKHPAMVDATWSPDWGQRYEAYCFGCPWKEEYETEDAAITAAQEHEQTREE